MFAAAAFHDTFFAYTPRLAFGSRIFPHPDERELPAVWQSKRPTEASPRDSIPFTLNDVPSPDVRSIVSEATMIADTPAKVDPEKGHVSGVPSDFRRVPWLCHLHRWHTRYHLRVPCQRRRRACRTDSLCGWLRTWSV